MIKLLLTTLPSSFNSSDFAKKCIETKMATCISIIPSITSIYCWNEEICEESEQQLIIKTDDKRLNKMLEFMTTNHPYEIPEILILTPDDIPTPYRQWIQGETC